jgi:hypothetical protein
LRQLACILALAAAFTIPAHLVQAAAAGNPCALLSLAEAQSITGLSLESDKDNPLRADLGSDKNTTCTYQNDDNQMVSVMLHDDTAYFPGNAKNTNTEGFKRVTGIGQRAWSSAIAMAVSVEVLENGRYVSVRIANPDGLKDRGARNYAAALKLAKLVAGRM